MAGSLDKFLDNHPALNRNGPQTLTRAVWGGIAQEFDTLKTQVDEASAKPADLANIVGEMLDELIVRFTGIERITNESDESRIKIMYAFFRKSGATSWATPHAIKKAMTYYFPADTIYIQENAVESSWFTEGSFEAFEAGVKSAPFGDWTPAGSQIEVVSQAGFHGARCVKGTGTGTVSQTVAATQGAAILSTAYRGNVNVTVQRASDSKYWNFAAKAWQIAAVSLALANATEFYKLDEQPIIIDDNGNVTVTYSLGAGGTEFFIDYLSFGPKPSYPFIKVLVSTFGQSGEFLNNWPGTDDPVGGMDYDNATFFGIDYLGGEGGGIPTAYYQRILDYVKTAGAKALFEFVGRE